MIFQKYQSFLNKFYFLRNILNKIYKMINIERFNPEDEFKKLLAQLPVVPANIEISEKTSFSPSQVSGIMSGKVNASTKFVEAFKKGFKLNDTMPLEEKNNPSLDSEGFFKKDNNRLVTENEFLKQTVKDLLNILASK